MMRKIIVLEIKKTQTKKTFVASKHSVKARLSVFSGCFVKIILIFLFI